MDISSQLKLPTIQIHSLTDVSGFNLLMVAVNKGDIQIVKILLKLGFDVNFLSQNETPASLAWKNKQMEVLLVLLEANSLFPPDFEAKISSEEIKKFCNLSRNIRISIKSGNLQKLKNIIIKNPNLKYFYDEENISAAAFALKLGKIEIYKELVRLNVCIGPKEDIDKVTAFISEEQKDDLRRFHKTQAKVWTEKHLMVLLG
jgi:ankyrin repeat protein